MIILFIVHKTLIILYSIVKQRDSNHQNNTFISKNFSK